jgi:hypothetical protein
MTILKFLVRDQLANAPGAWLTVAQLVVLIPAANGRDSTVARALRKLRSEGHVAAQPVPGNARYRQWSHTNGSSSSAVSRGSRTSRASAVPTTPATVPSNNTAHSKGRITMSTFQTAIESVVNEFIAAQKTFSAFEITKELRDRSNAGTVTIDKAETGSVHVTGNDVPRIDHDQVKGVVVDLFSQGKMVGYDRSNNGQYWQYGPAAAVPAAPDPSASGGGNGSPPPIDGGNYDGSSSL